MTIKTLNGIAAAGGKSFNGIAAANLKTWNGVPWPAGVVVPFANVKVLLHFDGTDASTTFTDVIGRTFTAVGNAQLDTAQQKFGTASGLFDGTGDVITTPDHADFALGTNDFTIEFWLRPNTVIGALHGIASQCPTNAAVTTNNSFQLNQNGSGLDFHCGQASLRKGSLIAASVLTVSTWHHIAYVRYGNMFNIYVNGTSAATVTESATINDSTAKLCIGTVGETTGFNYNGWIDDFRFVNGTAAYTANFTPPTAPFPDA